MKFTDTWIRSLVPRRQAYRKFEKGLTRGFGLKIAPSGSITFFLCYQATDGKTKYKTLGKYPVMSLANAREAAAALRVKIGAGEPVDEPIAKAGSLKELCDYYIKELKEAGKKSWKEVERALNREVLGVLGEDTLAAAVTAEQVRDVMHRIIERGAGVQANRVRSFLHSAYQTGIKHDFDPRRTKSSIKFGLAVNPVAVVPHVGEFESVGDRVLTLEELSQVWNYKGEVISKTHLLVFKLIILFGGMRPSEVTQAKLEEFDFSTRLWSLPPERSKNRRWNVLPITDTTKELVSLAIAYGRSETCLFPNKVDIDRPESTTSFNHAIKRLTPALGMVPWKPSDLRRTVKTWAGYAGISKDIRDRIQNHALSDVSSKHYDRHLYLQEKLQGLKQWEEFILNEVS